MHVQEIEFYKGRRLFYLEIDTEDPDNLVIESVTDEHMHDLDPEVFEEALDIDDWQRIKETLTKESLRRPA